MAKIRPCQTVGNSKLKKYTHPAVSLVDEKYDGMSVVREVRTQRCRSAKEVQKCLHKLITGGPSRPEK